MIKLEYMEGGKVGWVVVDFVYEDAPVGKGGQLIRADTQCQLYDPEGGDIIGIGEALLHQGDQFSKRKGRVLSFGRALKAAGFSKSVREQLWHHLFTFVRVA